MPGGRRPERVADLLRAELAELLRREVRDPRVGFVTVTDVRVSPDLRSARVHVSVLGEPEREAEAVAALRRAAGFLRRALAHRLRLRYAPELHFHLDPSLREGARVTEILSRIEDRDGDE